MTLSLLTSDRALRNIVTCDMGLNKRQRHATWAFLRINRRHGGTPPPPPPLKDPNHSSRPETPPSPPHSQSCLSNPPLPNLNQGWTNGGAQLPRTTMTSCRATKVEILFAQWATNAYRYFSSKSLSCIPVKDTDYEVKQKRVWSRGVGRGGSDAFPI